MSISFRMPALPLGGSQITLCRWLKRAGDQVAAGEPLLIVRNDRLEVALPAPSAGQLAECVAAEGAAVAVGAEIARFAAPARPTAPRRSVSPVARRVAAALGVALESLTGSGPRGRIDKRDVLRAAAPPPAPAAPPLRAPHAAAAPAEIPYVLTAVEVDCTAALAFLGRAGASLRACVASAAVAELLAHPLLNSAWCGDHLLLRRRIHLGVAGPDAGAHLPTVRDAQDLNVYGMARALARQADPAADYTFAVVDADAPAWPVAPAAGLRSAHLRIGAIRQRPWVVGAGDAERLAVRPVALLALAYDARIHDQPAADAFLRDLKRRLERFDGR